MLNFLAVSCGQPLLRNGTVLADSFDFQDSVAYVCDPGYKLRGSMFSTCLATGTWSGRTPKCQGLLSGCWFYHCMVFLVEL